MDAAHVIQSLRDLTERKEVEFLPLAQALDHLPEYAPAAKYLKSLRDGSKPETASEELFLALFRDLFRLEPARQVIVRDGWVDFLVQEPNARVLPVELKALFHCDRPDKLRRHDVNPDHHRTQIKNYLTEHEYLLLTDLRTAWLCSARDYFFEEKPFATLPFADFLQRCLECRSITDALRRSEDTADKPELEKQFFEDLENWFREFDKVDWQPAERAAEFIILLLNKLIFAKTLEDFGLVPYRCIQDEYALRKDRWQAKGAAKVVKHFLREFEDFFDEFYDTEIFAERIWDKLRPDEANYERFCRKLEFILGLDPWNTAMGRGVVNYNYRRIDEDIFGKSYEMFLAANRKDEGIYYTPAGITGPMADSMVDSLAAALVTDICDAVGSQKCDFAHADALMAELAEIRIADTACGSGGFLIKVLRAFWRQYQRIDDASVWVKKILRPDNGEMYLAEFPPNVESALAFRHRWHFDNKRKLMIAVAERHLRTAISNPIARSVATLALCRTIIPLCFEDMYFRTLIGTVRAFPDLNRIFSKAQPIDFFAHCFRRRAHRCLPTPWNTHNHQH